MRDQLEALIQSQLLESAFELYDWRLDRGGSRGMMLRVYLHGENGPGLDDCAAMSRNISAAIEEAGLLDGGYVLEVSSPGMDRILKTARHFEISTGARASLRQQREDGEIRTLEGEILGIEDGQVLLGLKNGNERLPLEEIQGARLLPDYSFRRSKRDSDGGIHE